ncbi:MAG: radical SAM protein, partial [Terriglobales bacterium]
REVVISGINLGRWGRDLAPQQRFEDLVRAILDETPLERLRLSSIEPVDWTDELIVLVAESPRIAKHVHAPLQSGSDRILRAMHRKYRPWHYAERIRKVRDRMPLAAIGADVMVGFPGETDALFEESHTFIASLPFTYLHVFTFSARPGTPAATLPGQVPVQVARARNRILRELAGEKNFAFRLSLVGQTLDAITLDDGEGESTEAITDNYLKLQLRGRHAANHWLQARIESLREDGLIGSISLLDADLAASRTSGSARTRR